MKLCPRCAAPLPDEVLTCPKDQVTPVIGGEVDERLGKLAGGFRVLDVIGRGGMATVYRTCQLSIDRLVAVKVLSLPRPERELKERFLREARETAKLRSPHAVIVFDSGALESGELFLAMELLAGRSLDRVLKAEGVFSLERARRVIVEACLALEDAHARRLVHRDLKPANIMLEPPAETVKVVDFGIVKVLGEEGGLRLTQTGTVFGTPAYMAPEMWNRKHGEVGPGTDVYALGTVMFEVLAGRLPFEASSAANFAYSHVLEEPMSIASVRAGLGDVEAVDRVIGRCLAKSPADRYATIRELREAVEAIGAPALAPASLAPASLAPASLAPLVLAADPVPASALAATILADVQPARPRRRAPLAALVATITALLLILALRLIVPLFAGAPTKIADQPARDEPTTHSAPAPDEPTAHSNAIQNPANEQTQQRPLERASIAPDSSPHDRAQEPASETSAQPRPAEPAQERANSHATSQNERALEHIRDVRAVGTTVARARAVFAAMAPSALACFERAPPNARKPTTLYLIIDTTGAPTSLRLKPENTDLATCLKPIALRGHLPPLEGAAFATISATLTPSPSPTP